MLDTVMIGRNGTLVIPAGMRQRLGIDEGALVSIEETDGGLVIRLTASASVEIYTRQRKAEFLLNNAIERNDYEAARQAVRDMGLDPDVILHDRPRP